MGKIKSTVSIILISIVIAVLAVFSVISFDIPGSVKSYNSVLNSFNFGSEFGGYSTTVFYPEDVMSAEDYANSTEEVKDDYEKQGGVYVKKDVTDKNALLESVKKDAEYVSQRLEAVMLSSAKVSVQDGYTIRIDLPASSSASEISGRVAFDGDFTLTHNSVTYFKTTNSVSASDYFKSASVRVVNSTPYIVISLTNEGRELIKTVSGVAKDNENDKTIVFAVGDNTLISLNTTSQIDESELAISGYADEHAARTVAAVLDGVFHGRLVEQTYSTFYYSSGVTAYGENTLMLTQIAIGVIMLIAIVVFFIVNKGFGVSNMYSVLSYAVICIWGLFLIPNLIPSIVVTISAMVAILFSFALMLVSNFIVVKKIKAEVAVGKTISNSVKSGYKASYPVIAEMHVATFILSLIIYFFMVGEAQIFAICLTLSSLVSLVFSMGITRFYNCIFTSVVKDKYKFLGLDRRALDDED